MRLYQRAYRKMLPPLFEPSLGATKPSIDPGRPAQHAHAPQKSKHLPSGHLEKFFSPSRYESDSLTAMGHGRIERASHGADGLFRSGAQARGVQRASRCGRTDQEERAVG